MEPEQELRLRKNHIFLLENVDLQNAIYHLFEQNKLEQHEIELIKHEITSKEKCTKLLSIIKKKQGSYDVFLGCQQDFIQTKIKETRLNEDEVKAAKEGLETNLIAFLKLKFYEKEGSKLDTMTMYDRVRAFLHYEGIYHYVDEDIIDTTILKHFSTVKRHKGGNKKRRWTYKNLSEKHGEESSDEECMEGSPNNELSIVSLTETELFDVLMPLSEGNEPKIDSEILKVLQKENINGEAFKCLTNDDLKELLPGSKFMYRKNFLMARDKLLEYPIIAGDRPKQEDAQRTTPASTYNYTTRESFRQFDVTNTEKLKYSQGGILRRFVFRPSNLIEPLHFFLDYGAETRTDPPSKWIAYQSIKIAAACMNERTNATIHFGIKTSSNLEQGEVIGMHVERKAFREELFKSIRKLFYDDQIEIAKSCIRPMQFINTTGCYKDVYVIEIDIVSHSNKLINEAIFIKEEMAGNIKSSLFRLEGETLQPFRQEDKQIQDYMKCKDSLTETRKQQENKPPDSPVNQDLKKRFLDIFTGGNETLCHEIYPMIFVCPFEEEDNCNEGGDDNDDDDNESIKEIDNEKGDIDGLKDKFDFIIDIGACAVFDFDPCNDEEAGIYNLLERNDHVVEILSVEDFDKNGLQNGKERDRHTKLLDHLRVASNKPWVFCNGHHSKDSQAMQVKEWKQKRFHAFKESIRFFSNEYPKERVIPIFLLTSKNYSVMLEAIDEVLVTFPDQWILFAENYNISHNLECELIRRQSITNDDITNRMIIGLPWNHINQMFNDVIGSQIKSSCKIPTSNGILCTLPERQKNYLCDLDILSSTECSDSELLSDSYELEKHRKTVEELYYRGGKPSWWNLWFCEDHVKKRNNHKTLMGLVEKASSGSMTNEDSKVAIIELLHQPGAGGSTSALQILWDCKLILRCCSITHFTDQTCDQIKLFWEFEDRTPRPVLVLIDNMDEEKVDHLYEQLENQAKISVRNSHLKVFCILLICKRRTRLPLQLQSHMVILKHELEPNEHSWFTTKYEQYIKKSYDQDRVKLLISFHILKENFNIDYIKRLVRDFIDDISDPSERTLLLYLSFLNTFDIEIRPIPVSSFDTLMKPNLETGKVVFGMYRSSKVHFRWETKLSQSVNVLLNRNTSRYGNTSNLNSLSIINPLFARQIFEIIKSEKDTSVVATDFLNSSVFNYQNRSVKLLLNTIREIMKKRQENEDGKKEEFSPLILEVKQKEDVDKAAALLEQALDLSKDPMIAQTLARLYINGQNWDKAALMAKKATDIRSDSSYLWDTHGQVYKNKLFIQFQNSVSEEDIDISMAIKTAKKAIAMFRKAQTINRDEPQMNDAGYFNEVRVSIILLDILKMSCLSKTHLHKLLIEKDFPRPGDKIDINLDASSLAFLKRLHIDTDRVMRQLEEMTLQVKENSFTNRIRGRNPMYGGLASLRENIDSYFGEDTDEAPEHCKKPEDRAEFHRRRIKRLGGRSLKHIFSLRTKEGVHTINQMVQICDRNLNMVECNAFDLKTSVTLTLALHTMSNRIIPPFYVSVDRTRKMHSLLHTENNPDTEHMYLECFLYLFLFHWPTEARKSFNLFPIGKLQDVMIRWKHAFQRNHTHSKYNPGKNYRQQKETTLFFLGLPSGDPYSEIVYYEELSDKTSGKFYKGDTVWTKPETIKRLKRLHGFLLEDGNGTAIKCAIDTDGGSKMSIPIPTAMSINDRSFLNKKVYFYLGFSWAGPKAYDVSMQEKPAKFGVTEHGRDVHGFKSQTFNTNEAEQIKIIRGKLQLIQQLKKMKKHSDRERQKLLQENRLNQELDQLIRSRKDLLGQY